MPAGVKPIVTVQDSFVASVVQVCDEIEISLPFGPESPSVIAPVFASPVLSTVSVCGAIGSPTVVAGSS